MEAITENVNEVGGRNLIKFWRKKLRVGQSSNVMDPYTIILFKILAQFKCDTYSCIHNFDWLRGEYLCIKVRLIIGHLKFKCNLSSDLSEYSGTRLLNIYPKPNHIPEYKCLSA